MDNYSAIVSALVGKISDIGMSLIGALLVLIIGLPLVGMITKRMRKSKALAKMDKTLSGFFISFMRITLIILVVVTAAVILGIPMTSFVAILASCGVAVGLALQGALGNFAGGIILLIFKPFRVGDYITAAGYSGTVRSISVFYTTVVTSDRQVVTLPNGELTGGAVVNHSVEPYRRVELEFSASYSDDVDKVVEVLQGVGAGYRLALADPAPFAFVSGHGDSAIIYKLHIYVTWENYWDTVFEVPGLVKKAFDDAGIEIPFPQVDVHQR